jgi:hypothetical protein
MFFREAIPILAAALEKMEEVLPIYYKPLGQMTEN